MKFKNIILVEDEGDDDDDEEDDEDEDGSDSDEDDDSGSNEVGLSYLQKTGILIVLKNY